MKAMILAAGMGKRLGDITKDMPKVLIEINGKSMLQLAVEKCTSSGFDDIVINVYHFADMVIEEVQKLKQKGFRITISDERPLLLETGGGLFRVKSFFDRNPFLLYNADIVTDIDLPLLYKFHQQKKGLATLAVRNRPGNRYFLVNPSGLVRGWCNKATGEKIVSGNNIEELTEIAFSGIHIIDPAIFEYMGEGVYSMTALYLQLACEYKIYTYLYDGGYWGDVGTPENLENIRNLLKTTPL